MNRKRSPDQMRSDRSASSALLTLLFVVLLIFVAGCGQPEAEAPTDADIDGASGDEEIVEQVLRYNIHSDPQNLYPADAVATPSLTVLYNVLEGLVRFDQSLRPVPAAAKNWEISPDGLTYTFELREAQWSNGDPVTAEHFRSTWLQALSPESEARNVDFFFDIRNAFAYNEGEIEDEERVGLEAPDDQTLIIHLEQPAPYFLTKLAHPSFAPLHPDTLADTSALGRDAENLLSNGPFLLDRWVREDQIVLLPNEQYRDSSNVFLDQLIFFAVSDRRTELTLFETGELDLADHLPLQELGRLQEEGLLHSATDLGTFFYFINTEKEPFDDPRLRRALAAAVDRTTLTEEILQGGEEPAYAFVSGGIVSPEENVDYRRQDEMLIEDNIDEAKSLIEEAGYGENGDPLELILSYPLDETHRLIAEYVQHRWQETLGLSVELKQQDFTAFQSALLSGDYEVGSIGWGPDYLDPLAFLILWRSDYGLNISNWQNEDYDALLRTAEGEAGHAARFEAFLEAERFLAAAVPAIPLYYYTTSYLKDDAVEGLIHLPLGPSWDFRSARIVSPD